MNTAIDHRSQGGAHTLSGDDSTVMHAQRSADSSSGHSAEPTRFRGPRFLHLLTAIHATGAVACFLMAVGSGLSEGFREALVVSGGSEIMVEVFGRLTWMFLAFVGLVLAILAYGSGRVRPWAWHLTLIVYGIGVLGSLWQISVGIREAWLAAVVNGAVVAYAARPVVREAYR